MLLLGITQNKHQRDLAPTHGTRPAPSTTKYSTYCTTQCYSATTAADKVPHPVRIKVTNMSH